MFHQLFVYHVTYVCTDLWRHVFCALELTVEYGTSKIYIRSGLHALITSVVMQTLFPVYSYAFMTLH